jgi:hypothetical protein
MIGENFDLEKFRKESGLAVEELSRLLQISENHYYDLEDNPQEIFETISLRKLRDLFLIFRINGSECLVGQLSETGILADSFESFRETVNRKVFSNPELSCSVGWDLSCLEDSNYLESWNFEQLKDISNHFGITPVFFLKDINEPTRQPH